MQTIDELIAAAPVFAGLEREQLELIAGCGAQRARSTRGDVPAARGRPRRPLLPDPRRARSRSRSHAPGRGALMIETLHAGDLVGWSWLFAPYRWQLDARALEPCALVAFDGACLRGKCDADHELGYQLDARFAGNAGRAPAGHAAAAARRLRPRSRASLTPRCRGGPMVPAPFEVSPSARTPPTPGRSSSSRAGAATARVRARASSRCSPPAAPARCRSRSAAIPTGRERLVHTVRAVGLATAAICAAEPGDVLGVRGPFGRPWPVEQARGRRCRDRRGRDRPGAAAAGDPAAARAPRALRPARAALRRALARPAALHRTSSSAWRERGLEVLRDGRQRRPRVARPCRRRHPAGRAAPRFDPARDRRACAAGPR